MAREDAAPQVHGSERFIEEFERYCKGTDVRAEFYDGKDHSSNVCATIEDKWLAKGLAWIEDTWLPAWEACCSISYATWPVRSRAILVISFRRRTVLAAHTDRGSLRLRLFRSLLDHLSLPLWYMEGGNGRYDGHSARYLSVEQSNSWKKTRNLE
jgi:hypothetical protein